MPKKIKSARYTVIFFSIYSYVSNLLFILIDLIPQFLRQPLFYLVFKKYGKQSMIDYKCYFRYPWRISIGHQVAINRGCQFFPSMRSDEGWIIIEDNAVLGPYVKVFSHYKISFMYAGNMQTAFIRFAMAHVVGLSVNIFMHVFFTKFYNYPHQIVQLAAIPTVAVVLYLLLNNFVFPREIKA